MKKALFTLVVGLLFSLFSAATAKAVWNERDEYFGIYSIGDKIVQYLSNGKIYSIGDERVGVNP